MGKQKDEEFDDARPLSFIELAEIPLDEMDPEQLQRFELLTSLEEKKQRLEMSGALKHARRMKHDKQEEIFRMQWNEFLALAGQCNHWKGGDGLEGLKGKGDGGVRGERAILPYVLSQDVLGYPRLHCTRCHFEWLPGFTKDWMYRRVGQKSGDGLGYDLEWLRNPTGFSYADVMEWRNGNHVAIGVKFQWGPKAMDRARREIVVPAHLLKESQEGLLPALR